MPRSTRSPCAFVWVLLVLGPLTSSLCLGGAAEKAEQAFRSHSEDAAKAREKGDLEEVERIRLVRLEELREFAADDSARSSLLDARRALISVDGSDETPGLVNSLQYDEAAKVLHDAWTNMVAAAPNGPILGEVAVRLFELVHQKAAFWAGASATDAAAKPPVGDRELLEILTKAQQCDSCCVASTPLIEWLKPLDPKESFLRAEVRPAFKARQERLLSVSHPLLVATTAQTGNTSPNADALPASEGAERPVLPWHAATEYLKAQSYQLLIDETDILEDVLQNWYSLSGNTINYIIPRRALKGVDANGNRFEMLYGRLMLTSIIDRENRRRPATLLLDNKGDWEQRILDLLYREPSDTELKDDAVKEAHNLVMRLEVLEKWNLGGKDFRLCAYPIHDTDRLLKLRAKLLCLKDSTALAKLRFKHANNDLNSLIRLLDDRPGAFNTDPRLQIELVQVSASKDRTLHPLIELTKTHPLLVVLSRSSRAPNGPAFFNKNGIPFLRLQDRSSLFFQLEGEGSPICYRDTPFGRLCYPLTADGIPSAVVLGCGAGKCMTHLLGQAGYARDDAAAVVRNWISTKQIPKDFVSFIQAKANATQETIEKRLAGLVDATRESELGLKLEDKDGHISIPAELIGNFLLFGYRHFYDNRGNIFYSASLRDSRPILCPDGGYAEKNPPSQKTSEPEHAFAMVQPDGRPIDVNQLYSFDDFVRMKASKSNEYLIESLMYAPSFGTYELMIDDASRPFVHPDDKSPIPIEKPKGKEGSGRKPPPVMGELQTELKKPVAPWLVSNQENQLATLTNLHNAYFSLIKNVSGSLHKAANDEKSKAVFNDAFERRRWIARTSINSASRADIDALFAIQLASARLYAKQRHFHRAVIYYNDLLERLPSRGLSDPYKTLLEQIPTTADGLAAVAALRNRIDELNRLICIQAELGGVLLHAGKPESAQAIFSRIVDDYTYFVWPTFEIMRHLLTSYGLQMEEDCERAVSRLKEVAELSASIIRQHKLAVDWRVLPVGEKVATQRQLEPVVELCELIELSTSGKRLGEAQSKELERLRRLDQQLDRPADFRYWLERKKTMLGAGNNADRQDLACQMRIATGYDVRNSCPLEFLPTARFSEPRDVWADLIQDCSVDEVLQWCEIPAHQANNEPLSRQASFLIAWYWADLGDYPKSRAALINLCCAHRDCADKAGEKGQVELVHRLNIFRAIATASCLSQSVPGVRAARVDFTDALRLQSLMWEREWLAAGLPHHEASKQADELDEVITEAQFALTRVVDEDQSQRYFFPDYTCDFGGIPNFVVDDVLFRPDLFHEMKPEDVEGKAKARIQQQEREWILVSKEQALAYFRGLPKRVPLGSIDRKVVGVD
jgi:hypothetical protein